MNPSVVFQPTFLYESLWDLGVVALVILVDRKHRLRRGKLFPLYIGGYFLGRAWVEELRSDEAAKVFGVRWNFILAIAMVIVSIIWILWRGALRPAGDPGDVVPLSERFDPNRPESVDAGDAGDANAGDANAGDPGDAEVAEDGVGEPGPGVDSPRAEVATADGDEGEVDDGVDPDEGARSAEVPEGGP
jgi:hypothetical protein